MENKFRNLGLTESLVKVIGDMNFIEPSEIQKLSIPPILEGKDVIGLASTGSGKTLAFVSGIIKTCIPQEGIQALVMAPTRELAEQIGKVTRNFSKNTGLKITEVFGGVGFGGQISGIKRSEIIVGTPGRIKDHLNRGTLNLSKIKVLVLDEADRMVDMGFIKEVEFILNLIPEKRQTLLFSATNSSKVKYLENKYMKQPITINVEKYVDPTKLKQIAYDVPSNMKFSLLVHSLKEEDSGIIMIFCNTRRMVDILSQNLKSFGLNSTPIHGGLEQKKRSRIIENLHNNEVDILVCTDVAARGLDIKGITHVYNYNIPKTPEEYIHRIGRTARAGEKGMAINLVSSEDYENFQNILDSENIHPKTLELPKLEILHPVFKAKRDFRRNNNFQRRPSHGRYYRRR